MRIFDKRLSNLDALDFLVKFLGCTVIETKKREGEGRRTKEGVNKAKS